MFGRRMPCVVVRSGGSYVLMSAPWGGQDFFFVSGACVACLLGAVCVRVVIREAPEERASFGIALSCEARCCANIVVVSPRGYLASHVGRASRGRTLFCPWPCVASIRKSRAKKRCTQNLRGSLFSPLPIEACGRFAVGIFWETAPVCVSVPASPLLLLGEGRDEVLMFDGTYCSSLS